MLSGQLGIVSSQVTRSGDGGVLECNVAPECVGLPGAVSLNVGVIYAAVEAGVGTPSKKRVEAILVHAISEALQDELQRTAEMTCSYYRMVVKHAQWRPW